MHLRDQEEVQAFFSFFFMSYVYQLPPLQGLWLQCSWGDEIPSQLFPQVAQVEGAYVAVELF